MERSDHTAGTTISKVTLEGNMKIQILGPDCAKCTQLAENTAAAARELGIEYALEYVRDWSRVMTSGAMITPGLVLNGEVRIVGRVPSCQELKHMLNFVNKTAET
jgi:small redox-active disulfide protein 2